MNGVERLNERWFERKCIGLHEFERVVWLRRNIYADNVKSCLLVANGSAPGAAKEVKQSGPPLQAPTV